MFRSPTHLRLALVAASLLAVPSTASATTLIPSATPLSIAAPGVSMPCPTPSDLDGTALVASVRDGLAAKHPIDARTAAQVLRVPQTAVAVCDPVAAAEHRFVGAIRGETAASLPTDFAWPGQRGVADVVSPSALPALRPGDHVTFPPLGATSTVDVAVATTGGAREVHVTPTASAPVALRVEGTLSAPTVVVDHGAGEVSRITVAPVQAHALRLRAQLVGRDLRFSGSAGPHALAVAFSTAKSRYENGSILLPRAIRVAAGSGRFSGLTLERVKRTTKKISVLTADLAARTQTFQTCALTWPSKGSRPSAVRCKPASRGDLSPAEESDRFLDPFGVAARPASTPHVVSAAPARPYATAARAVAPVTAPAVLTPLRASTKAFGTFALTAGDLNRDGRPDAFVSDDQNSLSLLVSSGATWTAIPVKGAPNTAYSSYPDLTGDGAAELQTSDGVLTDAFAGPTLPTGVNLGAAPTRFNPGLIRVDLDTNTSVLSELVFSEPSGSVPDVTGDGRPEIVFGAGARYPVVVSSVDYRPGATVTFAKVHSLVVEHTLSRITFTTEDDTPESEALYKELGVPSVTVGGTLAVATPLDRRTPASQARRILVQTLDALGDARTTRSFVARGVPQLFDYDPASGDALVMMWQPGTCLASKGCADALLRVAADGTVESTVTIPRLPTPTARELRRGAHTSPVAEAAFVKDGPDADDSPDVALWGVATGFSLPPFPPTGPLDGSVIGLLASTASGPHPIDSVPLLASAGKVVRPVSPISHVVLPDGSRWLGASVWRGQKSFDERAVNVLIGQP